jgi:large subunit ribosomal protein L9
MKVILLRDVAKIGRRFEVKEVPAGHATNFLIPRKLAEPATPEALRRHSVEMKKKSIMTERHDSGFKSVLESLKGTIIEFAVPANEQGHLFKGVHEADIAGYLTKQGMAVTVSEIVLPHPIKETGEHVVTLKSGDVTGTCTIRITKA